MGVRAKFELMVRQGMSFHPTAFIETQWPTTERHSKGALPFTPAKLRQTQELYERNESRKNEEKQTKALEKKKKKKR